MADTDNAANPLLRRALALKQEASDERRRADRARRHEVAELIGDDANRIEYLRTLADHPKRTPEEIVALTRYRQSLGLERLPRIMTANEIDAYGLALKEGASGIELTSTGALMTRGEKIRFYAVQEVDRVGKGRFDPMCEPERRIDTSDPAAMDAFVAATDGCDLDSLDPMAEFAISVSYGLDLPDDPAPPLPPAETAEQLYDALSRIGQQVETVQMKIDTALKRQRSVQGRKGRCARADAPDRPRRSRPAGRGSTEGRKTAGVPEDRPKAGKKGASLTEDGCGKKALAPEAIMAMGTADVVKAVHDRTDRLAKKGNRRI